MKCKKIISSLLATLMLASVCSFSVNATDTADNEALAETPTAITQISEKEAFTEDNTVQTEPKIICAENEKSTETTINAQPYNEGLIEKDNSQKIENKVTVEAENSTEPATVTVEPVQNFNYSSVTTNSITLNWNANPNATGYVIYRMDNTTNSQYVKFAVLGNKNTTTFTDKKVTSGRCFYYQIKAYLKDGDNFYYSSPQTVKLGTCPDAVTGLTVTQQTSGKINIKWNKVSGASGYIVYRMDYKTNGKYKAIITVDSNSTSISNVGLESGRPYYYRVRAYKEVYGKKFYGGYPTLKTATLPADVTNLKVKSQSTNNISITWDRTPRATGYVVYRMDASTNGKYKKYAVIKSNTPSFNDTGLTAGRCYYYRVRAYRYVDGKYYYGGYPTLKTGTKTITPSFTLSSKNNKITAKWSKVSGAEGYAFYLAESKNAHYYLQGSTTGTSYTSKTLTNGKTYYIRVCAYNLVDGKKIYSGYQTKSIKCSTNGTVNGYYVGDTYVEISIDQQHMWYYKNGNLLVSTDVVTGMKNSHDTPKGLHKVLSKSSPANLVGETWDCWVDYWIAITYDGVGIHDSTWRTGGYGGSIYTYDGSHGCINTPYSNVQKIYNNITVGTPVVIY